MEHDWGQWDHPAGGAGLNQQPQYILVDDHDHWPTNTGPPGVPTLAAQREPLPPLPGVSAHPPGKPLLAQYPDDDDDATESEEEQSASLPRRAAALGWQPATAVDKRPESVLTGTSAQPLPAPSGSGVTGAAAPAAGGTARGGSRAAASSSKARKPGGKGGITLRLLIEEGVLEPGHNVLSVDYKGMTQLATLMPDGRISSSIGGQHMVFESPSAFSIYLKRLVNPSRKADDGWKTVRYNNRVLEQYKAELAKRRLAEGSGTATTTAGGPMPREQQHQQTYQYQQQQQQQQQQPLFKRARVDSSSDLTGGSVTVSATVKEGDRNVLKLKFARPKKPAEGQVATVVKSQCLSQAVPAGAAVAHLTEAPAGQQTEYARSRPRRQVQAPPRYAALGHDDEHALQPLEAYQPGAQPFTVYVSPAAEVLFDFHAHLRMNEVIGILAGVYDAAARTISVLRAHPVRELATEDDSINVEMDPEDEWHVRQQIAQAGMRCVGWYHSHPNFPTQPSTIDIYNQVLQQHHNRDEVSGTEPYIAAIVGPYDKRLPGPRSSVTWFYVDHPSGRLPSEGQQPGDVGCVAKALRVEQLALDSSAQTDIAGMPTSKMQQLAHRYVNEPDAVDMAGMWRDNNSCAQKLAASLLSRLSASQWSEGQVQEFGNNVHDMLLATRAQKHSSGLDVPVAPAIEAASATPDASEDEEISDLDI